MIRGNDGTGPIYKYHHKSIKFLWMKPFIWCNDGTIPSISRGPVENVFLLEDLSVEGALCKRIIVIIIVFLMMMMPCLTSRSSIVVVEAS